MAGRQRLGCVAVHSNDAIPGVRRGQESKTQAEEEHEVNNVDLPVPQDVSSEAASIGVDVGCVGQTEKQPNDTNRRVVVVTSEVPVLGSNVNVEDGVELDVPGLGPQQCLCHEHRQQSREAGKEDAGDRPWSEQRGCGPVVGQRLGGEGLRHRVDHYDANADVHDDPNIVREVESAIDGVHSSDRGQEEGVGHKILEGGNVGGEASAAFADEIHDSHQRLAISSSGEWSHHGSLGIRKCKAGMGSSQATAIIATITAHSHHQVLALEVFHDIDLVLRLHTAKHDKARPDLFELQPFAEHQPPGPLCDCKLSSRIRRIVHIDALRGIFVVGVDPPQIATLVQLTQEARVVLTDDPALLSDGDPSVHIVTSADNRPDGAFLELYDGVRGVRLHLVAEEQEPTEAQAIFQCVSGHIGKLLFGHGAWERLGGDAQNVVATLGVLLSQDVVRSRDAVGYRDVADSLVAPLHEDLHLVLVGSSDHNAAGHATMIEVQLLQDLDSLLA
mmetsp:Transcript_93607/g.195150  ORF Transcript_93607/g.195150 Transcript_93607/m.195150 type:complete len:501 (+) Transcript_93607:1296-2798(+)